MSVLRRKTAYQFEIEKTGINAEYDSATGNVCTDIFRYTDNDSYSYWINIRSNSDFTSDIIN